MSDETPFILFICNDLFYGSKVTSAAGPAGVRLVTDSSGTLEAINNSDCLGVILDMNHPTATPAKVSAAANDGLRLLAFGPHVRTELFEAAKEAGFETVTRGQFDRSTSEVLKTFA